MLKLLALFLVIPELMLWIRIRIQIGSVFRNFVDPLLPTRLHEHIPQPTLRGRGDFFYIKTPLLELQIQTWILTVLEIYNSNPNPTIGFCSHVFYV